MNDVKQPTIEELLNFPAPFTIKVMGENVPELIGEVCAIVAANSEGFEPERDVETQPSSKGNYLSVRATFTAVSKEQLDKIYLALNNHALVKITL